MKVHTGPISARVVSSRTFSMGDFEGFRGGGLMRVPEGIIVGHSIKECESYTKR